MARPKTAQAGNIAVTPISAKERKVLTEKLNKRHKRLRRRHREIHGKIVDWVVKAKEMMDAGGFRRLPVVHEGRVVGILTERDLREHGGYLESTKVDAAMKTPVVSVESKASVEEAARLMLANKIGDCRSL